MCLSAELTSHLVEKGFFLFENFLPSHEFDNLHAFAKNIHEQGQFKRAKIGDRNNATNNETIRNDSIYWLDEKLNSAALSSYFKQINRLKNELNQSLFLGLLDYESHFAVYETGSFYKKHIDQFATNDLRQISCVYYLNPVWERQWGGELNLYNTEDELILTSLPRGNLLIGFNSNLPHEVCLAHHFRYSIAGWFKKRNLGF